MSKSKLPNQPYKIGLYIRVASACSMDRPDLYMDLQEKLLRDYVNLMNREALRGNIVEVCSDLGCSGMNTDRPAFQKMLSKIESGEINFVLTTDIARISRSLSDLGTFLDFTKKNNCFFDSLQSSLKNLGHEVNNESK